MCVYKRERERERVRERTREKERNTRKRVRVGEKRGNRSDRLRNGELMQSDNTHILITSQRLSGVT